MTVETEIAARLGADGAIVAIAAGRIHPLVLPQKPDYPAITYGRVSGVRLHDLAGSARRDRARLTIGCWAATYDVAKDLAAAVRLSLDGFNGPLATRQAAIKLVNELDLFEEAPADRGIYRVVQDYTVHHAEPAALDWGAVAETAYTSLDFGAIATAASGASDWGATA